MKKSLAYTFVRDFFITFAFEKTLFNQLNTN